MKRFVVVALAALASFCTGTASAQLGPQAPPAYGPGYRPLLSPYLNLLRGGDPASNYFLGTIPEYQRRANAQLFSQEIGALDRRLTLEAQPAPEVRLFQPLPETGHPTAFGYTNGYFGSGSPVTSGGLRGAAGLPAQRRGQ